MTPIARVSALALATALLAGCGGLLGSGPPPSLYVIGDPAATRAPAESGRPLLVRSVTIPEYLDSRDILIRTGGNVLTISETGQWGERLSVGISRALGAGLTARLDRPVLSYDADRGGAAQDLVVDIESFDVQADGSVTLAARWQVYDPERRRTVVTDRAVLEDRVAAGPEGLADAAVVATMSALVGRLADEIAASL